MNRPDRLGRSHQRPALLTGGQQSALIAAAVVVLALALWHLTLVLTAGVEPAAFGVSLSALLDMAPLDLPARYAPAGAAPTIGVFVLLAATAFGLLAWSLARTPRRRAPAVGLATAHQARRSAGEIRARDKAGWIRKASVDAGLLDVDTAPLADVAMLLGHTTDDAEPIILTLEDQTAVLAPTGGGKTLYLMIGACIDAPGPLIATSTRPEILDAITEARTGPGRVWVFDPLDIAHWPEPMVWDPVAGAGTRPPPRPGPHRSLPASAWTDPPTPRTRSFSSSPA